MAASAAMRGGHTFALDRSESGGYKLHLVAACNDHNRLYPVVQSIAFKDRLIQDGAVFCLSGPIFTPLGDLCQCLRMSY